MSYLNDPEVKALIEKKKNEAAKLVEDEKFVNQIIKERFWSTVLQMYNRYRFTWTPEQCPVNKMVESYNIINEFKNSIEYDVKNTVKEYFNEWWGDKMDNALNKITMVNYDFNDFRRTQDDPLDTIVYRMMKDDTRELWFWDGNTYPNYCSHPPPAKYWKGFIVRHIAEQLIHVEFEKLNNYWIRYKERSKRESEQEAKKIIKELEEKVKLLTERNSILEEKFAIFSKVVSIN
jgi:hypothetical protein